MIVADILTIILILAGMVFFLGAVIGIVRFPDAYTRIHAAGKGDTLSTILILLGLGIYNFHNIDFEHLYSVHNITTLLVSIKIGLIFAFIFFTSPTTTHVLMEAAWKYGVSPWKRDMEDKEDPS